MKITRRGVLFGILAASGATLAGRRFPWDVAGLSSLDDFVLELLRVVAVPDPVLVGEARLQAARHLRDEPEKLLDSVLADLPIARAGSAREVAVALREQARRQFETGDVVRAGGWVLARVEADLCALVALDRLPGRGRG